MVFRRFVSFPRKETNKKAEKNGRISKKNLDSNEIETHKIELKAKLWAFCFAKPRRRGKNCSEKSEKKREKKVKVGKKS